MITPYTFMSHRIHKYVMIVRTEKKIHYITEDDEIYSIKNEFHFDNDGYNRAEELFDDPRFEYWLKNKEI